MAEEGRMIRSVGVFCGSSQGNKPIYREAAAQLGRELAMRGITLVYGAGDIGLMGIVANATLQAGGRVIGVIPRSLREREVAHLGLTELHVVETMHERKALMADRSDAFLALPGGYGTADELFEILTWAQLGMHGKPIGLVNLAGFFDPLLAWVEHSLSEGFLKAKHLQLLHVGEDVVELLQRLCAMSPRETVDKWATSADR